MNANNYMTKDQVAQLGEQLATNYLIHNAWTIIDRNWSCRLGEIDIIAYNGSLKTLAFVEVRTLIRTSPWRAEDSIRVAKQKRIARAARLWLSAYHTLRLTLRFDIIAVTAPSTPTPQIRHYPAAFTPPQLLL